MDELIYLPTAGFSNWLTTSVPAVPTKLPTSSPIYQAKRANTYDVMSRVYTVEDGIVIQLAETHAVQSQLYSLVASYEDKISVLKGVVHWQRKNQEYQAAYTSMLLGSCSQADFEEEAAAFERDEIEVDPVFAADQMGKIRDLTGIDFDTSEFADYFSCSQENVMRAAALLSTSQQYFSEIIHDAGD